MIDFNSLTLTTFLNDYWQKKPLVIRQALPEFIPQLTAEELAGLSMEPDIESRTVIATPNEAPYWHLKKGPFTEKTYKTLPDTHWTLLVQGVDRVLPELAALFDAFDFIPQWRIDDLMVSYATKQGSVGPHYDNYDVFLYQAQGTRRWLLTTQGCHEHNYLPDVPLRIMREFPVEVEYVLEAGDMLYLPAQVGHHGIALTDDCMTYSFGYRSYTGREMWEQFSEYHQQDPLYQDPNWSHQTGTAELPPQAWQQAKAAMQTLLDDEQALKTWFGCFVTQLDEQADALLPTQIKKSFTVFQKKLLTSQRLLRDPCCRFAYQAKEGPFRLFINGCEWESEGVSEELMILIANHRSIPIEQLQPWLQRSENLRFLYDLWTLQWLTC